MAGESQPRVPAPSFSAFSTQGGYMIENQSGGIDAGTPAAKEPPASVVGE
jgi:hypothetical protein